MSATGRSRPLARRAVKGLCTGLAKQEGAHGGRRRLHRLIIARPRAAVADYAARPDNAPRWYANIKSVAWRTEPPLAVASRVAFVAHFLGRRLAYTYEIVDFVPGERLVMRTAEGPFPMETTYLWTDAGEGATRMTLRNRGAQRGFAGVGAPAAS